MSDHIQQTIELLEHEIEALEQRSGELGRVIEALRPLAGGEEQPARPIRRHGPAKAGRKAKKIGTRALNDRPTDRPTDRPSKRRAVGASLAARSLPKNANHAEAILSALRAKSPQAPGELMQRTGFGNLAALRYQLKPLVTQGLVTVTGVTTNRQVSLGRARPAKEEP